MKLAIASDLHLEFGTILLQNPGVDALVLAGDIMLACVLPLNKTDAKSRKLREKFTDFFDHVNERFPKVFYVMGNHEHYHGDFRTSAPNIREFLKRNYFENVTLLDKDTVEFQDKLIFGATLWSDFNKGNPMSMLESRRYMNDYSVIEDSHEPFIINPYNTHSWGPPKLKIDTVLKEHRETAAMIDKVATDNPDKEVIIIGHHSPSYQSIHEQYKLDKYVNGAYHSDLEGTMWTHSNIQLWVHGHTHFTFDYYVNATNVVCNPRGYVGYEQSADDFKLKIVEL